MDVIMAGTVIREENRGTSENKLLKSRRSLTVVGRLTFQNNRKKAIKKEKKERKKTRVIKWTDLFPRNFPHRKLVSDVPPHQDDTRH